MEDHPDEAVGLEERRDGRLRVHRLARSPGERDAVELCHGLSRLHVLHARPEPFDAITDVEVAELPSERVARRRLEQVLRRRIPREDRIGGVDHHDRRGERLQGTQRAHAGRGFVPLVAIGRRSLGLGDRCAHRGRGALEDPPFGVQRPEQP
jgi:hypothetical protein